MGLPGEGAHMAPQSMVVQAGAALKALRYSFPIVMLLYFLLSSSVTACLLKRKHIPSRNHGIVLKKLAVRFGIGIILTFVLQCFIAIARTISHPGWWAPHHEVVYYIASIISWGALQLSLTETKRTVWQPFYGTWTIAIVCEIALFGLLCKVKPDESPGFHVANLAIAALRLALVISLPVSFVYIKRKQFQATQNGGRDEERGLLSDSSSEATYGIASGSGSDDDSPNNKQIKKRIKEKVEESGNWWNYAKSFAILWPYIWPGRDRKLQFIMAIVGVIFVAERGLNVLIPHQLGRITDALATRNGQLPWTEVILFVIFRFLNSESGLSAIQGYLWIPIDQYSYKAISTKAYDHVMSLSHDYHSEKKSGELYSAVSSGRSINWFVEMMIFNFFPMMADVVVAFIYFNIIFDAYMGLIVAFVLITYVFVTTKMGRYKESVRRDYVAGMREETNLMWETLGSWQTVTYFNRISYERGRYSSVIDKLQRAARKWQIGMTLLAGSQSLVLTVGLLSACFLAVYQISSGSRPVGAFVTLLTYWGQLSGPLSFFGSFMRRLQTTMIDAEKLLELLQTKPTVKNSPNAKPLEVKHGEVVFNDVDFGYDERKPTINGVTFTAKPGETVAIVGETGAGKTTLLKLLFRFYDINGGSIQIDGQNIKDVTLESLRENMGVVPQDPALFNDTIMNNLKYANFDASEEDIYNACRAAAVHDKILSFPDGYNSKVGERGVKLSGGELQRVAIARAILKNPKIVLLDEATSMVDLETERQIQQAFKHLAENRTTFVVAHRLSTIMNAHTIIVLHEGKIIESGNHDTLLAAQGKYHSLWLKHIKNDGLPPDQDLLLDDGIPEEPKKVDISEDIKEVIEGANISDLSEAEPKKESAIKTLTAKVPAEDYLTKAIGSDDKNSGSSTTCSQELPESKSKNLESKLATSSPNVVAQVPERPEEMAFVPGSKPSLPKIMTSNLKPDAPVFTPSALKSSSSMSASTSSPVTGNPWTAGPSAGHSLLQSSNATSPEDTKSSKETRNYNGLATDSSEVSKPTENIDQTAGKSKRPSKQNKNRHKKSYSRKELSKVTTNEMEGNNVDNNTTHAKAENPNRSKGNGPSVQRRGKHQKGNGFNNASDGQQQQQQTGIQSAGGSHSIKMPAEESSAPSGEPCSTTSSLPKSSQLDSSNEHPGRANNSRRSGNRRISLSSSIKDKVNRRHGGHASASTESKIERNIPAESGGSAASGENSAGANHK